MAGVISAPPRRLEALAYIYGSIRRSGRCPSYDEIGEAMRPRIGKTRVRGLIEELIKLGPIQRLPGSHRGIGIRDEDLCRRMIDEGLTETGWQQLGPHTFAFAAPCTNVHLPLVQPFEHIPDVA